MGSCSSSATRSRPPPSVASFAVTVCLRLLAAMVRLGRSFSPLTPERSLPATSLPSTRCCFGPSSVGLHGDRRPPHSLRQLHRPSQRRLGHSAGPKPDLGAEPTGGSNPARYP